MLPIQVYSDYVCPYCFLGEQVLLRAIRGQEDKVNIAWMPFELRPYPSPTLKPEGDYLQQTWQQSVYPLADQLGVPIVLPRVSPQPYTHLAFEGFQFAKENGLANAYNHRMFTAFFQEEQNIGEIEVLTKLAAEIGLDPAAYRQALEQRTFKAQHQQALQHAAKVKIAAVPTFVIGHQIYRGLLREEDFKKIVSASLVNGQPDKY
jgi:predicted DsbA family dithiol-disulfide isomerase